MVTHPSTIWSFYFWMVYLFTEFSDAVAAGKHKTNSLMIKYTRNILTIRRSKGTKLGQQPIFDACSIFKRLLPEWTVLKWRNLDITSVGTSSLWRCLQDNKVNKLRFDIKTAIFRKLMNK